MGHNASSRLVALDANEASLVTIAKPELLEFLFTTSSVDILGFAVSKDQRSQRVPVHATSIDALGPPLDIEASPSGVTVYDGSGITEERNICQVLQFDSR